MVESFYNRAGVSAYRDPLRSGGFMRGGAIPVTDGGTQSLADLPRFLRTLLVTDGTVTKILEAYFWEPITVDTLEQEFITAHQPLPWIHVADGDRVLMRRARLRGADSGHDFAEAYSVIRTELIPRELMKRLINREISIGVLIRDSGLESYREVMDVGMKPKLKGHSAGGSVFRTYRITIGAEPVILITESFPLAMFPDT